MSKTHNPKTTRECRVRLEALESLLSQYSASLRPANTMDTIAHYALEDKLIAAINTLRWVLGKPNYIEEWALSAAAHIAKSDALKTTNGRERSENKVQHATGEAERNEVPAGRVRHVDASQHE